MHRRSIYSIQMKDIKNVLFDLDGTIIASKEGFVNSVLYALDKLGIKEGGRRC